MIRNVASLWSLGELCCLSKGCNDGAIFFQNELQYSEQHFGSFESEDSNWEWVGFSFSPTPRITNKWAQQFRRYRRKSLLPVHCQRFERPSSINLTSSLKVVRSRRRMYHIDRQYDEVVFCQGYPGGIVYLSSWNRQKTLLVSPNVINGDIWQILWASNSPKHRPTDRTKTWANKRKRDCRHKEN